MNPFAMRQIDGGKVSLWVTFDQLAGFAYRSMSASV